MKKVLFLLACATIIGASVVNAQTTPAKTPEKQKTVQTKKADLKKDQKEVKQDKSQLKTDKATTGTSKKTIVKDQVALHKDKHDRNKDIKKGARKMAERKKDKKTATAPAKG